MEILDILTSCGLFIEDLDPQDKRKKRYYLAEKFLPASEGENKSITEVYEALRAKLTNPFHTHEATRLIIQIKQCSWKEAENLFEVFQNEGKVFLNAYGLWEWTK